MKQVGTYNYSIKIGEVVKVFHINMMKKYYLREPDVVKTSVSAVAFEDEDETSPEIIGLSSSEKIETFRDVNVNPELSTNQKEDIMKLLEEIKSQYWIVNHYQTQRRYFPN